MSNKDGGGAASPSAGVMIDYGKNEHQQGAYEGMSMRDYFAAKAMQAALSACGGKEFADNLRKRCADHGDSIVDAIAEDAYTLADAMLAERAK